jgi:Lrp/AsnC family transcriptional regulator
MAMGLRIGPDSGQPGLNTHPDPGPSNRHNRHAIPPEGLEVKLDPIDRRILDSLQRDADVQVADLAQRAGTSTSSCWRRIQRLREAGVITRQVALVDPRKVNVGVTVFVAVKTSRHTSEWFERFRATAESIPEVVEFYRMSGDIDYLLRVVVPDIAAYDSVYKRLTRGTELADVSSSFAMQELKFTTAVPLDYA